MMLHAWLAGLLVLAADDAGPIDAYLANKAAIDADIRYEYHSGAATVDPGDGRGIWAGRPPGFVPDPSSTIFGRWATDGDAELFEVHPDPDEFARRPEPEVGLQFGDPPMPMEALYDGKTFARHDFAPYPGGRDRVVVKVMGPDAIGMVGQGAGPFHWGDLFPLETSLARHFPGGVARRKASTRGGHPTEVEIYQAPAPEGGSIRVDVHYDPSIGHLPRFIRAVSRFRGHAYVNEHFLVDARACRSGGFLPTEWYCIGYAIANVDRLHPDLGLDDDPALVESRSNVHIDHFRATEVKDRAGPVAMERVEMIQAVEGHDRTVPLASRPESLTLPEIRSTLGPTPPRGAPTSPPLKVSRRELDRFPLRAEASGRPWMIWVGVAALVGTGVGVVGFSRLRRRGRRPGRLDRA